MPEIFRNVCWELQPDLEMFMEEYMSRITPDFVKLSIGCVPLKFMRKLPH